MGYDVEMNESAPGTSEKWISGEMIIGQNKQPNNDIIRMDVNGCIENSKSEYTTMKNVDVIEKVPYEKVLYRTDSIFRVVLPTYTILTDGLIPQFINMKWLRNIENFFILNCPLDEVYKSLDVFKKAQRYYCMERKLDSCYFNMLYDSQCSFRYLSVRNMIANTCTVNINKYITIKSDNSTIILSFDNFLKCVEIFEPDIFCIPSEDIKVGEEIGKKKTWRIRKIMEEYLEKVKCMKQNTANRHMYNSLKFSRCFVSVPSAIKNANEIISNVLIKYDDIIDGYLISGLGYKETVKERTSCLQNIMKILSKEKIKIIQLDVGNPIEILHSVYNGINLIEAKFPFILAQIGKAIIINPRMDPNYIPQKIYHINDIDFKKGENFIINLTDPKFTFDYKHISENSFRKESRSYIYHLLKCKEMTANVLLTYHNLYMYSLFFKEIQKQIQRNNLENYISWFIEQNDLF